MSIERFGDRRDWFFERRYGLFVHWGLYAIPAWHEQALYRLPMDPDAYEGLIHQFNPDRFDADQWLDLAESVGMEYVCFTTKHVDGFCMWDTAQTDYKVTRTPYGKDVLALLAEACHRRRFPLCLYYAIPDMHHESYPHAGRAYEYAQAIPRISTRIFPASGNGSVSCARSTATSTASGGTSMCSSTGTHPLTL